MVDLSPLLVCPLCAKKHRRVELARGEHADCVQCGALLEKRSFWGDQAPLAFTITALVFAVPSLWLPFATLSKFGSIRISFLLTGVRGLWNYGMPSLAVWALFCAVIAPILELIFLAFLLIGKNRVPAHFERHCAKVAYHLQHWAMPEVYVLGVLVAFFKIADLADANVNAGFYCYCAMAFSSLLAWRTFTLEPAHRGQGLMEASR